MCKNFLYRIIEPASPGDSAIISAPAASSSSRLPYPYRTPRLWSPRLSRADHVVRPVADHDRSLSLSSGGNHRMSRSHTRSPHACHVLLPSMQAPPMNSKYFAKSKWSAIMPCVIFPAFDCCHQGRVTPAASEAFQQLRHAVCTHCSQRCLSLL